MKKFIKVIFLLIVFSISSLLVLFVWFNRTTGVADAPVIEFEIVKGDNTYTVANRLYEKDLIRSKRLFIILVRSLKLHRNLKPGWIHINTGTTTIELMKQIFGGNFITVSFTVPEGASIKQIQDILLKNDIVPEEELNAFLADPNYPAAIGLTGLKSAEGFLFPDTYKFYKGVSTRNVFENMVELFFSQLELIDPNYKKIPLDELQEKIIMASIIEKEVRLRNESRKVAGVFYNRIKIGMKLQSCATIQYVLGKPKEQLLETDLFIDHPYNTYIYRGLPPGPIGNPGYKALEAAFYPEKHDYIFFVVKDPAKGSHHFSVTYEEHLQAQARYKKIKGFY